MSGEREHEWWADPRLATRIEAALHHFNAARTERSVAALPRARALLSGINVLYNALAYRNILNGRTDDRPADAALVTKLILGISEQRRYRPDGSLRGLCELDPALMDQSVLINCLDNPWSLAADIPPDVRAKASKKHDDFKSSLRRYVAYGTGYRKMLRELASTIAVFRNNLQHGEKMGIRERDQLVAEAMLPVLEETVDLVFCYPSQRLATYGLLDDARFAEITGLVPNRRDGVIVGTIVTRNQLRYLKLADLASGQRAAVSIAEFPSTEAMYRELDAFEGEQNYRRVLVLARCEEQSLVCNVYAAKT